MKLVETSGRGIVIEDFREKLIRYDRIESDTPKQLNKLCELCDFRGSNIGECHISSECMKECGIGTRCYFVKGDSLNLSLIDNVFISSYCKIYCPEPCEAENIHLRTSNKICPRIEFMREISKRV